MATRTASVLLYLYLSDVGAVSTLHRSSWRLPPDSRVTASTRHCQSFLYRADARAGISDIYRYSGHASWPSQP